MSTEGDEGRGPTEESTTVSLVEVLMSLIVEGGDGVKETL